MKYWLSHLPLEVWVDVFCYPWRSREEIGLIVDKFRNHTFAEYLQFYLHDWGKQTLRLTIDKDHIPPPPMPANIKFLGYVCFRHLNAQTLDFLRQIRPILMNFKLKISLSKVPPAQLHIILANLVPLVKRTHKLDVNMLALSILMQNRGEELTKLKQLTIASNFYVDGAMDEATVQAAINFLTHWLTDNGAKLCELRVLREEKEESLQANGFCDKMISAIREEFLAAETPHTFAVSFVYYYDWEHYADFHLENGIGEELHGVQTVDGKIQKFRITRHKANCGTQLQEVIKELENSSGPGEVKILYPTIGLIDAMDAHENDQQKPSTSKDA